MLLSPQDAQLFFKLHRTLMFFVNERLQVVPNVADPDEFSGLSPEVRFKVRDAFLENENLIEIFVDQNPFELADDDLGIILSWRQQLAGDFYIFRYLKKYTVFLSSDDPPVAYGVLALTQPFEELIGPYLPVWTKTVLLPFKDQIIYDGLLSSYNISFGPGIRRSLNESFKEAKERQGIVTTMPMREKPPAPRLEKWKTKPAKSPRSRR